MCTDMYTCGVDTHTHTHTHTDFQKIEIFDCTKELSWENISARLVFLSLWFSAILILNYIQGGVFSAWSPGQFGLRGRSCENWDVLLGHLGPGGPECILRSLRPYGDFWGHLSPKFSLATYSSLSFWNTA